MIKLSLSVNALDINWKLKMNSSMKDLVVQAGEPYTNCEVHMAEMYEKNIACLVCQKLICPVCYGSQHLNHEIMSVNKLRELKTLGNTIETEVNTLQSNQLKIQKQITERENILKKILESKEALNKNINKGFDQLCTILKTKESEVIEYVEAYYQKHHTAINKDLKVLEEDHKNASLMIKSVLQYFNKLHVMVKDCPDLPVKLKAMSEAPLNLPDIENVDAILVENKFDKILPSLQAIANICQSIHPEATKICWSKVSPSPKPAVGLDMNSVTPKTVVKVMPAYSIADPASPSTVTASQPIKSSPSDIDSQMKSPDTSLVSSSQSAHTPSVRVSTRKKAYSKSKLKENNSNPDSTEVKPDISNLKLIIDETSPNPAKKSKVSKSRGEKSVGGDQDGENDVTYEKVVYHKYVHSS